MLRFGSKNSRANSRPPTKIGWRIWIIVGLIGMVIGIMQALEQPATVTQLDAIFQPESSDAKPQAIVTGIIRKRPLLVAEAQPGRTAYPTSGKSVDLSEVEDNTYFLPQESAAWFAILDGLSDKTSAQIRSESVGDVAYAQLLAQPNVYRGKVVSVQGRVLRQESLDAPENDVGITSYHRLVIRPQGGGVWPIIVYCLDLPASFPRGEKLDFTVAVQGVFFKNWSYAWDEGLGLAPVLLAKTVSSPSTTSSEQPATHLRSITAQPPIESSEKMKSDFHEVLEIVGLGPAKLQTFSTGQTLTDADWQILTQLLARLQQYNAAELARWTLPAEVSSQSIGELLDISGSAFEFDSIPVPTEFVPLLGLPIIYRCQIQNDNSQSLTVFTAEVPHRWPIETSLNEPVRCRAVLLRDDGEDKILATNRLSWFPESGVPSGELLLAQHGMDAALWDAVKQRGEFVTPESSREAEAFFTCLAALDAVPADQLSEQVFRHLDRQAKSESAPSNETEKKITDKVAEQAQQGYSSVVPMFLTPEKEAGELVRLEGIVRRAVRIFEEDTSDEGNRVKRRDYYELELFTPDSQNLPVVCCVSQLPPRFPLGDEIREQIRIEGVFFKSWQYRSRKLVDASGETTHQQQPYTPIVLAKTVTWLQPAPERPGWWGLAAGIGFLIILAVAWVYFISHWREDRRQRTTDEQIDLPRF